MPKTTRNRGGTICGLAQNQGQEPLLLGKYLMVRDGRIEFMDGTGALPDTVLDRDSAGVLRMTGTWRLEGSASTSDALTARVTGDAAARFVVNADGKLEWGAGSGAVDTNLYRDSADTLKTDDALTVSGYTTLQGAQTNGDFASLGDISISTAGKGLKVKEGSNATMGVATLTGGAATVSTTKVTATSRIFLTSQADGGTVGFLRISARSAGTSFTITSSSALDTSTVAWLIVEPAS
ncbi:hypothetical protein I5Q34_33370 [Streptomyces sp. AV19]|uniref:hypothetical protein n=1 Tax=Streptomyces sp. AV19 TaxID=2793068 RepID=UPI0018FEDF6B|nr:hypothetical protein [Streptomyces sp. AV19]MBH1939094.1 hypothetical protein [Streptomyces sp. AV19]MDG4531614.1 hypothetical protein [Streptomyces sp. AV19]